MDNPQPNKPIMASVPARIGTTIGVQGTEFQLNQKSPNEFYTGDWAAFSEAITGIGKVAVQAIDLETQKIELDSQAKMNTARIASAKEQYMTNIADETRKQQIAQAQAKISALELQFPDDPEQLDKALGNLSLSYFSTSAAGLIVRDAQVKARSSWTKEAKSDEERRVMVRASHLVGQNVSDMMVGFAKDPAVMDQMISQYGLDAPAIALEIVRTRTLDAFKKQGVELSEDSKTTLDAVLVNYINDFQNKFAQRISTLNELEDKTTIEMLSSSNPSQVLGMEPKDLVDHLSNELQRLHTPVSEPMAKATAMDMAISAIVGFKSDGLDAGQNLQVSIDKLEKMRESFPEATAQISKALEPLQRNYAQVMDDQVRTYVSNRIFDEQRRIAAENDGLVPPDEVAVDSAFPSVEDIHSFLYEPFGGGMHYAGPEGEKILAMTEAYLANLKANADSKQLEYATKTEEAFQNYRAYMSGDVTADDAKAYSVSYLRRYLAGENVNPDAVEMEVKAMSANQSIPSKAVEDLAQLLGSKSPYRARVFDVVNRMDYSFAEPLFRKLGEKGGELGAVAMYSFLTKNSPHVTDPIAQADKFATAVARYSEVIDKESKLSPSDRHSLNAAITTGLKSYAGVDPTYDYMDSASMSVLRTLTIMNLDNAAFGTDQASNIRGAIQMLPSYGLSLIRTSNRSLTLIKDPIGYAPPKDASPDKLKKAFDNWVFDNENHVLAALERQNDLSESLAKARGATDEDAKKLRLNWLGADGHIRKDVVDAFHYSPLYDPDLLRKSPDEGGGLRFEIGMLGPGGIMNYLDSRAAGPMTISDLPRRLNDLNKYPIRSGTPSPVNRIPTTWPIRP